MKIRDFDTFYEKVIHECIKETIEYAGEQHSGSKCIDEKKNIKKRIFYYYQKKRDYIKYNYMSRETPVALDRHKVAACMVYAILKVNPIKINRWIPGLPEKILLANEYLAFYVALNIIEMYKLDELQEENIADTYQIVVPKTYHENENPQNTYESNLCKAWYYIKIDSMKKFDTLECANIFFLLQKYTDVFIELEAVRHKLESTKESQ